jgi:hypothetical protein
MPMLRVLLMSALALTIASPACNTTGDCKPLPCPCCNFTTTCVHNECACANVTENVTGVHREWAEPRLGSNPEAPGGGASGSLGICVYEQIARTPVIRSVSVILHKGNLDHGTDTDTRTRAYARKLGSDAKADDAGHILANRLGDCGSASASSPCNGYVNIFPQGPSINRGIYRPTTEPCFFYAW